MASILLASYSLLLQHQFLLALEWGGMHTDGIVQLSLDSFAVRQGLFAYF